MVEAAVVGGDEVVGGAEHVGVDEAADGGLEDGVAVDGFEAGFGDFDHDGPVGARFGVGAGGFGARG